MPSWKCPVCGELLKQNSNALRCCNGHSFDIAKQGYVNLLMSNKSSDKRHGDDKAMVVARQEFLDKNYYACLRDKLCELAVEHCGEETGILDVGCGECWYLLAVKRALECAGGKCSACGVDISRQALIQASKRGGNIALAVGSVSSLPAPDASCDLLLNVFAPSDDAQFLRVLRHGGVLLKAVPLEKHLFALKRAVYDSPYENAVLPYEPAGFKLLKREDVKTEITLESQKDIRNLFMMTPYFYKTSQADQNKLASLEKLSTEIEFGIFVLKKE